MTKAVLLDYVENNWVMVLIVALPVSILTFIASELLKVWWLEKVILKKEAELDDIAPRLTQSSQGFLVNQGQLNKMVEKEQLPIKREIELLEKKRRFILDKLPIIGSLKK